MSKRHSLAFLLFLLSCFFCLDSSFWHGLASLNLVISWTYNSTPLFCATRFWHAWVQIVPVQSCIEISSCVWYQMKEWKMPLNMTHIVRWKPGRQWKYLTDKTGFLFSGTHGIGMANRQFSYCIQIYGYFLYLCLLPSDEPFIRLLPPCQILRLDFHLYTLLVARSDKALHKLAVIKSNTIFTKACMQFEYIMKIPHCNKCFYIAYSIL